MTSISFIDFQNMKTGETWQEKSLFTIRNSQSIIEMAIAAALFHVIGLCISGLGNKQWQEVSLKADFFNDF